MAFPMEVAVYRRSELYFAMDVDDDACKLIEQEIIETFGEPDLESTLNDDYTGIIYIKSKDLYIGEAPYAPSIAKEYDTVVVISCETYERILAYKKDIANSLTGILHRHAKRNHNNR